MKKAMKRIIAGTVVLFALSACAGPTYQDRGARTGVVLGAATGALLGQAIGRNTEGTILGAGLGAMVGGLSGHHIGAYMDRQEQELRDAVAFSEAASIQRAEDVLIATFQSECLFDFDSTTLKPGAYAEIQRVAGVLNRYPRTTIQVQGHTDTQGPESYNQVLSERRALAVKNALVQQGVDAGRIRTWGFGESQPVSSNHAQNRRVSIVITPMG